MMAKAQERLSVARPCVRNTDSGDVIVCGRRNNPDRLPLAKETAKTTVRTATDLPGGMAALTPSGRCGLFQGERRCVKAEALDYGYGGGRDPISVLTRIVGKVIGPETN